MNDDDLMMNDRNNVFLQVELLLQMIVVGLLLDNRMMKLFEKLLEFVVDHFLVLLVMLNFVVLIFQMIQLIYHHYLHLRLVVHFPIKNKYND